MNEKEWPQVKEWKYKNKTRIRRKEWEKIERKIGDKNLRANNLQKKQNLSPPPAKGSIIELVYWKIVFIFKRI